MKEILGTVNDCLTYYANDETSWDKGELAKKVKEELQTSRGIIQEWRLWKAIECLEWYADPNNWENVKNRFGVDSDLLPESSFAHFDKGSLARVELKGIMRAGGEGFDGM